MSTFIDPYQSLAPNFTPTGLTILNKNATSVTINWTAVNAADADGYVVYRTATNVPTTAVDVGNVTQYALWEDWSLGNNITSQ